MLSVHVMDADFTLQREIADYKSLRIRRSWHGSGEFELRAGSAYADVLTEDRIVFLPSAPHKAMIIETVRIDEQGVTVSGTMLNGILKRRICVPDETSEGSYGYDRITGAAETVLKHYVRGNCVETESATRNIACMAIEADAERGRADVPWGARFENLADVCEKIGIYADCGYAIIPDFAQKKLVFTYLPGRDRVHGAQRVTFSERFGNVGGTEYVGDAKSSANIAYIGGAGEDEHRAILSGGVGAGLARREVWAEAGSVSDPQELMYEAEHRLSDRRKTERISAQVIETGAQRYGDQWDIGDLVTVEAAGRQMECRITQVQESHEHGKPVTLSVTFGEPTRGIAQLLRDAARKEGIR